MRKKIAIGVATLLCLILALRFAPGRERLPRAPFEIIAHRGVHHTYDGRGLDYRNGCSATRIHPPTHRFIENTIPSMAAAFEAGATMVEIDVHDTIDGDIVVFHDWMLECRTDGTGKTTEHTMAQLRALDAGFGYTADGGRTFPLRGSGIGAIPSLREVLDRFPDRRFILNQKPANRRVLEILATTTTPDERARLHYWGYDPALAAELVPGLGRPLHSRPALKRCYIDYMFTLGLLPFPASCTSADVFVAHQASPFLWGWPNRFLNRAEAAGTRVFLWTDDVDDLPPVDGIMTDRIEVVGPKLTGAPAPAFLSQKP